MPNDDMKVIAVMSRKGGAGKTTLIRALASAAMRDGKRCIIYDTDPQQGMMNWATTIGINDPLLIVEHLEFSDELGTKTDEVYEEGNVDYIFVDTMGAAGAWADDLAAASDAILLPMKLSMDDWKSTNDTFEWYKGLAERAEDPSALPSFHVVLSDVPAKQSKTELEFEDRAFAAFPVISNFFMSRKQHREASKEGLLHTLAQAKRSAKNPLTRVHAKHFEEALEEAAAILKEVVEAA